MRTTIAFDDGLLEDAKRRAAVRGLTLSALVEEALRAELSRAAVPHRTPPFRLVTVKGTGPRKGVDLDRASALLAEEDEEAYRPRRR